MHSNVKKEGAKKCFFHVDNEVDTRGERKQKDLGAGLTNEPTEHKGSVSGLKTAQSNRSRTGSVLAGMLQRRFQFFHFVRQMKQHVSQFCFFVVNFCFK